MAKADFKSEDDYIASQPEAAQRILRRVRSAIRKTVPRAEEAISYQIPAYKLYDLPVLYFAGWKRHFSLYPASERLVAAFREQLAPYVVKKGTIRIPFSQPVPIKLIESIAKLRAKEVAERHQAKATTTKKR